MTEITFNRFTDPQRDHLQSVSETSPIGYAIQISCTSFICILHFWAIHQPTWKKLTYF